MMPSGDNRRRPFPCPDCGGPSRIGNNYDTRIDGVAGRSTYRFCKVCGAKFRTFLPFGDPPENEREIPMTGRGLYPRSRPAEKEPEPELPPAPPPEANQADHTIHKLTRQILLLRQKARSKRCNASTRRFARREAAELYERLKAIIAVENEPEDPLLADVSLEEIGITGGFDQDGTDLRIDYADIGGRGRVDVTRMTRREKTVLTQNPGMI